MFKSWKLNSLNQDFLSDFDNDFIATAVTDSISVNLIQSIDKYCVRKSKISVRLDKEKLVICDTNEVWKLLNWSLQLVINSERRDKYISRIMSMSQDDQIYMMQLIQHGDDFTVIDEDTESLIFGDDEVNFDQQNFDLKQDLKLLQEANDGLKWELNKVSYR